MVNAILGGYYYLSIDVLGLIISRKRDGSVVMQRGGRSNELDYQRTPK